MVRLNHRAGLFLPAILCASCFAQEPSARLDFADKMKMVNCETVSPVPVFRLKFNMVDAKGQPAPVQLPPADQLARAISIRVNDRAVTPFYAAAQAGSTLAQHRVTMILVDVSGSMNAKLAMGDTRFTAAKAAIGHSLEMFVPGVDRIAVIPFESHNVDVQIARAHFADTKAEALEQVNQLPLPTAKNNTALYSAAVDGLEVLGRVAQGQPAGVSAESMLVLMTDGKNEVFPGDDPGLLDGPAGLDLASTKVKASGIQVVGVGFGDPKQIDETALTRISTKHFMAQDQAKLNEIFNFARVLLNSRIQAAFMSPWPDRASLASMTLHVTADLKLPSSTTLQSAETVWSTPQMGIPTFEGGCAPDEIRALLRQDAAPVSSWLSVVRPLLVFFGLGLLVLILWFWVPRLVWADQYVGAIPMTQRWSNGRPAQGNTSPGQDQGPPRNAPAGFGLTRGGVRPSRAPSDATIVQPRPDFSKTRLDRDR